jgi:DNA modification methylase
MVIQIIIYLSLLIIEKYINDEYDIKIEVIIVKWEELQQQLINSEYYYYHTKNGVLLNGDCLEVMKEIPFDVIDAIITDPPYGTVKGMQIDGWVSRGDTALWDDRIPYNKLKMIFNKILRVNGVLILFSQEPFTSDIIINADSNIPFSYKMIWKKDHFANALLSKKAPVSFYEEICVFFKKHDINKNIELRDYFKKVHSFIGLSKKEIIKKLVIVLTIVLGIIHCDGNYQQKKHIIN